MSDNMTIFTFPSTHYALKAEKVLKEAPFKSTIIPIPREITSLCGLAIKVDPDYQEEAQDFMNDNGIKIEGVFLLPIKKRGIAGRI